ncbi:MAG: hypothetical protein GTO46_03985 [Gemmatimonadetes bacterium]|nr:hypothetical protein [Gemmatimonadota bacterium]NIO32961.1 hypothetical protein [Gemmatimonadota bacterium]
MKKPTYHWLTRFAAAALVLSFAVACNDDSTGPGLDEVDPGGTAAVVGDIVGSLEGNEPLVSYSTMGEAIGAALGGGVPAPPALDMEPQNLAQALGRYSQQLGSCSVEPGAVMAGPLIPTELNNTVFIWDPQATPTPGYVNGGLLDQDPYPDFDNVRFMLYRIAFDPFGGWEVLVDQPVGYVDFVDESADPTFTLRIIVTPTGASPVVDYTVGCSIVGFTGTLTASGFITDGQTQVNLDLWAEQNFGTDAIALDFDLEVPSANLAIHFDATAASADEFESETGTFSANFSVTRNNTIRFSLAADLGELSGLVEFCDAADNCATAAIISGTFDQPIITDAQGGALNPEAIAALGELFDAAGAFVDHLFPLLGPAYDICLGGVT